MNIFGHFKVFTNILKKEERRTLGIKDKPAKDSVPQTDKGRAAIAEVSLDTKALALFIDDQTLTKSEIAKKLGIKPTGLAPGRCPKLSSAIAASKARPKNVTRGSKGVDGSMEAWEG